MRSSLVSNVDLKPVPAQERAERELLEKFRDAKRKVGNTKWYGRIAPDRVTGKTRIQQDLLNITAEDVRAKWARGESFKPIGYDSLGRKVVPDEVKEAARLGYVCPNCWNRQESPLTNDCKIIGKEHGCGYTRGLTGY